MKQNHRRVKLLCMFSLQILPASSLLLLFIPPSFLPPVVWPRAQNELEEGADFLFLPPHQQLTNSPDLQSCCFQFPPPLAADAAGSSPSEETNKLKHFSVDSMFPFSPQSRRPSSFPDEAVSVFSSSDFKHLAFVKLCCELTTRFVR